MYKSAMLKAFFIILTSSCGSIEDNPIIIPDAFIDAQAIRPDRQLLVFDMTNKYRLGCEEMLQNVAMLVDECVDGWGEKISYFEAFKEDVSCWKVVAFRDDKEFEKCLVELLQETCQMFHAGWVPISCRAQLIWG